MKNYMHFLRPFAIAAGAAVYGAGISLFIQPAKMVPGGISGIAIIVGSLTGIRVGTLTFLMNIPLMAIALIKFGKGFFGGTLFSLALSSAAIDFFARFEAAGQDPISGALAGGTLTALGLGIIMRCGSTTGGADIIVKLIKQKKPYLKTGGIFLALDSAVALCSGAVFGGRESVIYSMLTICVCAAALNYVLYGADEAKLLLVVCSNRGEVTKALVDELGVGVSLVDTVGGYTGKERAMLVCAVRKQNLYRAKRLIYSHDRSAFMIVTSATAIYGEGFKSYEDSEL